MALFPFWFYTPPVLGGATLFHNSAPVVYKNPVPKDPEFYVPLALDRQKGQHLPAPEVYTICPQTITLQHLIFGQLILGAVT